MPTWLERFQALQDETPGEHGVCEAPEAPGRVGRYQAPCPDCGERWHWPTTGNTWVCSGCVVAGSIPTGGQEQAPVTTPARRTIKGGIKR